MSFVGSLATQRRVIGALILRELHTRYGRDNIGFLWFLLEPLIFMFGVLILWRLMRGGYDHNLPVIPLVFLGYPPLLLWRHIVARAMACVRPNVGLLYHRQVAIIDLFISRVVIEIAGNFLSIILCFWVLYTMGLLDWPANLPLMYFGYFCMTCFGIGMGLCISALTERTEIVEKIWTPIMYITNPITGAYLMAQWLPKHLRDIYVLIPPVNAFEMIRAGYFGDTVHNYGSVSYIGAWSAGLTLVGLWLFRNLRQHVVME
jgi:capsular polysaccharide transport system permease protein